MAKNFPTKTYNGEWWLLPATVKIECPQLEEVVEVRPAVQRNLERGNWNAYFEHRDIDGWTYTWLLEVSALVIVAWIEQFGWESVTAHNKALGYEDIAPHSLRQPA